MPSRFCRRDQLFDTIPLTIGQIGWVHLICLHTPSVSPPFSDRHHFSNRLLDKALTVENPVAYLYGVAKLAIRSYCYTHSQLITQVRGRPMVWTDSLDAPLCNGNGCLADFLVAPEQG